MVDSDVQRVHDHDSAWLCASRYTRAETSYPVAHEGGEQQAATGCDAGKQVSVARGGETYLGLDDG